MISSGKYCYISIYFWFWYSVYNKASAAEVGGPDQLREMSINVMSINVMCNGIYCLIL